MNKKHSSRLSLTCSVKRLNNRTTRLKPSTHGRSESFSSSTDSGKYLIIVGICLVLYANSLSGDFVHDDLFAVVRNKDVVSSDGIQDILFDDYWGRPITDPRSHRSYRPLTTLTFWLNHLVSGLHPFSFHLVNILLHALVSMVFMEVCHDSIFVGDVGSSFHAAVLFAVHPIHTEVVSGIVGRADILACLFFLLSFLMYSRYSMSTGRVLCKRSGHLLMGSMVCAACAMLSKENGITVLAVNAGYDVLFNVRFFKNGDSFVPAMAGCLLKRVALVAVFTVLLLLVRLWVMSGTLPHFLPEDNPASFSDSLLTRFLTFSYLVFFNAWLLLCPATLSYDWQVGSIPLVESFYDARNLLTLATFLALSLLAHQSFILLQDASSRPLFIGLLFLTVPFLPASNLFITVGFVVAERILYIPSMGYCILVVYGASKIPAFLPSRLLYRRMHSSAAVFVILILSAQTIWRNTVWQSRETLFRSGLQTLPGNAKVHYNWANYQSDRGNIHSAIHHYRETIRLYPNHASAHNNLATLLTDESEKEHHLKTALSIDAFHVNAHVNLGVLYSKLGNQSLAAAHLRQAVLLKEPENYEAISNLASILTERGELKEAESYHEKAVELQPRNADVLNNYGAFLLQRDKDAEARVYLERALSIQPGHVTAMGNLGLLEKKLGRMDMAESWYRRALSTERSPSTLRGLAGFYFSGREWSRARDIYRELLSLTPDDVDSILYLGQVLIHLDALPEGEGVLEAAVTSFPRHLELRRSLANIRGMLKKHAQALFHSKMALKIASQMDITSEVKARIHFEHGNILKNLEDYDEALKEYTISVSLDPQLPGAFLNIGGVHHLQGNYAEAMQNYLKAQRMDHENPILEENLRKLSRLMKQRQRQGG